MSKRIFKSNKELNEALDEIADVYSKPANTFEYLCVGVWLVVLPILGIIGYVYDILWLFYIMGSIITLTELIFMYMGGLHCLGTILLIVSCIIGYLITSSIWTGILLGSCITACIVGVPITIITIVSGVGSILKWFNGDK